MKRLNNSSEFIQQTMLELGFLLSNEKCQWVAALNIRLLPVQKIGKVVFIVNDRTERLQMSSQSVLKKLQSQELSIVPANVAASVVGQVILTQLVLGKIVQLKTRELYKCIYSRLSWEFPAFIS